jgi:hypothetical protein
MREHHIDITNETLERKWYVTLLGGSQHPSFEDSPQSVGDFVETDIV